MVIELKPKSEIQYNAIWASSMGTLDVYRHLHMDTQVILDPKQLFLWKFHETVIATNYLLAAIWDTVQVIEPIKSIFFSE